VNYYENKIGTDKCNQILAYSFQMKSVMWWKKVYFHPLSLAIVNALTFHLHSKKEHEKIPLECLFKMFSKGLISDGGC
jgi:hypothetical protein